MRQKFLLVLLSVLLLCDSGFSEGYFSIVGPRTVQTGMDYNAYLTFSDYDSKAQLEVFIKGDKGQTVIDKKTINLHYEGREQLNFPLRNVNVLQNFTLTAKVSSKSFEQSVSIFTITKKCSVFIQTSKATFKPRDTVQFRVLLLDAETRPYQARNTRIVIEDALGNILYDRNDAAYHKGVFRDDFKLDDNPVIGVWRITVTVDHDEIIKKTFDVAEYVLPRYEVFVDTNEFVPLTDNEIRATVYAKYTFGKLVKGSAKVTARVYDSADMETVKHETTKNVNVDTKQTVTFNMKRDLKVYQVIRKMIVKIEVQFTEGTIRDTRSNSAVITIHKRNDYNLEIIRPQKQLKPGFPYLMQVRVRSFDGPLETNKSNAVKLKVLYYFKKFICDEDLEVVKGYERVQDTFLIDGVADFTIDIPSNTTGLTIKASYMQASREFNVTKAESKTAEYLQAKVVTPNPTVGQDVKLEVSSTADLRILHSIVIGRTGVIHNATHKPNFKKQYTLKFQATPWMMPKASVIVYYMHVTGELVYDRVELNFNNQLPNYLNLTLSKANAKPGSTLDLTIATRPNSYIGLMAVDQRVLLLKSGNDIDIARVNADLMAYNQHESYENLTINGGIGRYLDFGESNAFVLTNANKGEIVCFDIREYDDEPLAKEEPDVQLEETPEYEDHSNPRLRKEFPETWLFEELDIGENDRAVMNPVVPDTMTSWIITGFAVDPETGLGLSDIKKLTVSQPFFIIIHLPYSIKYEEMLKVSVSIHNYIPNTKRSLPVEVTMFNEDNEFEFITIEESSGKCKIKPSGAQRSQKKTVTAEANTVTPTFFMIKPKVAGRDIKLRVKATSQSAGDEVQRMLLVQHEGITIYNNKPMLIDLRETPNFSYTYEFMLPENISMNSVKVEAQAVGDMLGPALDNVNHLNKQSPRDCCEQSMNKFIPNIVKLDYLTAINKLTENNRKQAEVELRAGYAKALSCKTAKSGFSIWTSYKNMDSIWLTAYFVKCLIKAKKYIAVDEKTIKSSLSYLKNKQATNGSFSDFRAAVITYQSLQAQDPLNIPLTAFTAITFMEDPEYKKDCKVHIDRALNYIDSNIADISNNYGMAIAAYALQLGKHDSARDVLDTLKDNAIIENDRMHWDVEFNVRRSAKDKFSPRGAQIELAAYALMAFVEAGEPDVAVKVMNWLITKRNSNGGFESTHDTVLAMEAIGKIAQVFYTPNNNLEVSLQSKGKNLAKIHIKKENSLTEQDFQLPNTARSFSISATGSGLALLQIAHKYNNINNEFVKSFNLEVTKADLSSNGNVLDMKICVNYIASGYDDESRMTIMEISLPSGFVYDSYSNKQLEAIDVRRIETKDRQTHVVLYFDKITSVNTCASLRANRESEVDQLKQSPVKVYDYYQKERQAVTYYIPSGGPTCSI